MFEETILLKIKREYTDNEKVAILKKALSEREQYIGILKSEISELQDTNKFLQTKIDVQKKRIKGLEERLGDAIRTRNSLTTKLKH